MRALAVLLVALLALPVAAHGQVSAEAGISANILTAEILPVFKARAGDLLASYLVQAEPNLTLSYNIAHFAVSDVATASLHLAAGFELFLGPDKLPAGGQASGGLGLDAVFPSISGRISVQLMLGYGTRGAFVQPVVSVSFDVQAAIKLLLEAVQVNK